MFHNYSSSRSGTKHKGVELDRLQTHHHNSRNTHLIIAGSVDIGKARDEQFKFRRVTYGPGEWVDLPSGIDYRGEAGDQGCVFVEGHTVLSPTTAERFERRRDIKRVPEGTPGAFTTS